MPNLIAVRVDIVNILLNKSDGFLETNSASDNICNVVLKFLLVLRKSDGQNFWVQKHNPPGKCTKDACLE